MLVCVLKIILAIAHRTDCQEDAQEAMLQPRQDGQPLKGGGAESFVKCMDLGHFQERVNADDVSAKGEREWVSTWEVDWLGWVSNLEVRNVGKESSPFVVGC